MAVVDRTVLRLGAYELLFSPQTPAGVVLNEAIELARRYGSANSPAFVNGVLDRIRSRAAPVGPPSPPGGEGSKTAAPLPRKRRDSRHRALEGIMPAQQPFTTLC